MSLVPVLPSDLADLCAKQGFIRPSRRTALVRSAPRVGQYYWVDFPRDAYAPEFVGEHPGIVVRAAQSLNGHCIVVPVTSTPQAVAKHTHQLSKNPNPMYPEREVWAVCSHLYTVSVPRLRPVKDKFHKAIFPKVGPEDMAEINACIRHALPHVFVAAPETLVVAQTTIIETVVAEGDD